MGHNRIGAEASGKFEDLSKEGIIMTNLKFGRKRI